MEKKWAKQYAVKCRDYDRLNADKQKSLADTATEPPLSNSPEDWLDAAREPVMRRKVVQDATTEQLAVILSQNSDGLLFMMDELSGFFGSMDLYRAKGGKDRPFWLQAKDGGVSIVDRRSHGTLRAENTAISVLGGIQPLKIKALSAGLAEDGMLQRFLPISVKRLGRGEDVEANKEYADTLEQTAEALAGSERAGLFKFSVDGDRELKSLYEFQEEALRRPGASPALRQWLEKTPNEFGRLALIFHFIEWHASSEATLTDDSPPAVVSGATARRARRFLTEFAYPHALVFHQSVLGRSEYEEHVAWIGGHILAHGLSMVTLRDIYKNYSPFKPPETRTLLASVMQAMEREDWLYPAPGRQNDGRTSRWFVNPAVHDVFATRGTTEREARTAAQSSIREEGARRRAELRIEHEPGPETAACLSMETQVSPTVSELLG